MNASHPTRIRAGFTLIEVLAALALCVLLAVATTSAIAFTSRSERLAARTGEASLLLPSLYAAQRLRPDELPVAPRGWRVDSTTEFVAISDDLRQEWHQLAIAFAGNEIPPLILRILSDAP